MIPSLPPSTSGVLANTYCEIATGIAARLSQASPTETSHHRSATADKSMCLLARCR